MKKKENIKVIVVSIIVLSVLFIAYIYRPYTPIRNYIDIDKIKSKDASIKIYFDSPDNSYIQILSDNNINIFVNILENLKVKRDYFQSKDSKLQGGYTILFEYSDGKRDYIVESGIDYINMNGTYYYFENEFYDEISAIFMNEKMVQNIPSDATNLTTNTNTKIYDKDGTLSKTLDYLNTQKLSYYLNGSKSDENTIDLNDENKMYDIEMTQGGVLTNYTLYKLDDGLGVKNNTKNITWGINLSTNVKHITYLLAEDIKFDDNITKISIKSLEKMPDMYAKGYKIKTIETNNWALQENDSKIVTEVSTLLAVPSDIMKDEEAISVKKGEEIEISTNPKDSVELTMLPEDTYVSASLYKEKYENVNLTRKENGSYYFTVPQNYDGEFEVLINFDFLDCGKQGVCVAKFIVE